MSTGPMNSGPGPVEVEQTTAEVEHRHHQYTGNAIPWFVRLIWVGFWAFAVYYTVQYLFPALQVELFPKSP